MPVTCITVGATTLNIVNAVARCCPTIAIPCAVEAAQDARRERGQASRARRVPERAVVELMARGEIRPVLNDPSG
jgi:hypothetical protein